ncbi:MAG: hypothetical protein KDD38_05710, partial [Bdellovibrionales bacterium]|nr:hypothetical protein [Bdellovibrionales bacterium]
KRSFVLYRLAWCHLNAGNVSIAKSTLLSALNEKTGVDASFRKDLTHDLATFIARGEVNKSSVDQLLTLSAESDKKANLFYLGQECDRLGNKAGSVLIWNLYTEQGNISLDDELDIKLRLAQNLWDQNKLSESVQLYKSFYEKLSKSKCKNKSHCDELRARSRSYVHTWIKKNKTNPTSDMLEALKTYSIHNSSDVEMLSWTAHTAKRLGQNAVATSYYRQAADQSFDGLKAKNIEPSHAKFLQNTLNGSLLAEIESAEASKDSRDQLIAYNHYLKLNPNGDKSDEVRYQIIYLDYKAGKYRAAADSFHKLVMNKNQLNESTRVHAADLALDSLAILKSHEDIEKFAKDFAKIVPSKRNEYFALSRQSAINQSAALYNNGKSSDSAMKSALKKLAGATVIGATNEDKLKIYKNQMLIAEKLQDLDAVDAAAIKILSLKSISSADVDHALERRLWVAEMRLDFKKAAKLAQSTSLKNMSAEDRYLKLAVLTELSGRSSKSYYNDYLKVAKNTSRANLVRAKMVKEARYPWNELEKHKKQLRRTPNIFGQSVLETFAKSRSIKNLKSYLAERAIQKSPAASILNRFIIIDENRELDREFSRHRLSLVSNSKIKKSMNERLALLAKADKVANRALRSGDFTLQIEALNRVTRENSRLAREISKMPIPRGLTVAQRGEYKNLLLQQAKPYSDKSLQAQAKAESLWKSSKDYADLLRLAKSDTTLTRRLVISELTLLSKWAIDSERNVIKQAIGYSPKAVRTRDIETAKKAIVNDPFDTSKISKLKNLEEQRGSSTFVAYLEARLQAMEKGQL